MVIRKLILNKVVLVWSWCFVIIAQAQALDKCVVSGRIIADDGVSRTRVIVESQVTGYTNQCTEPDKSWGSWDELFAIAEIFDGGEPFILDQRVHVHQSEANLNHSTDHNILHSQFELVLPQSDYGLYCFRGTHGVFRYNSNDPTRYGDGSLFCGSLGQYASTTGGGGTGGSGGGGSSSDPCDNNVAAIPVPCDGSPLVIDLNQNGIRFGQAGIGVYFDINGDGEKTLMQWVRSDGDEAFLVRDLNGNGKIDDGSELFGTGTRMLPLNPQSKIAESQEYVLAPNGFVALAQFDQLQHGGNDDGLISIDDAIWYALRLWLDVNADGISAPSELMALDELGFTHLNVIPKRSHRQDPAGNVIPFWSWVINGNQRGHNKYKMVDVFFKALETRIKK